MCTVGTVPVVWHVHGGCWTEGHKHVFVEVSGNLAPLAQANELAGWRHLRAHVDVGYFRAVDIARRVHNNRVQRLGNPPNFRPKADQKLGAGDVAAHAQ